MPNKNNGHLVLRSDVNLKPPPVDRTDDRWVLFSGFEEDLEVKADFTKNGILLNARREIIWLNSSSLITLENCFKRDEIHFFIKILSSGMK